MTDPRVLHGIGVSPGCAIGPAYVIRWGMPDVPHRIVPSEEAPAEIRRLREAATAVRHELLELRRRTQERAGSQEAKIFDAQLLMLEDPDFLADVERLIRDNQLSAERAFEFQTLEMRALWAQSESPMLQQRRADLLGVALLVLQKLMGQSLDDVLQRRGGVPVVVLARELTPGLTVEFDRTVVAGFGSVEGTRTSHAAILAQSLGIPCVMGLSGLLDRVKTDTTVILDGTRGTLTLDPTTEEIEEAEAREALRQVVRREFESAAGEPARTRDEVPITLRANLDLPEELDEAVASGAEGVGLVRTEFLVLGRTELPGENEQAEYFARVAQRFAGQPVVVRSYDLGGDKFPAPFRPPREPNPFLGWRAIRVCLDQPEIFCSQIRALLRARLHGDVQLMLPLVTDIGEVARARAMLREAADALAREGVPHQDDLPVGVMIETPAAALMTRELAGVSDFVSVGTNDLTQYTLAVDRGNAALADRFTSLHPAVVRALKQIHVGAADGGLEPSVCGEMASEPLATLLLLGLGYRVLSVPASKMLLVRWLVRQISIDEARAAADEVLQADTTERVTDILKVALRRVVDLEVLTAAELPDISAEGSFST